MQRLVQEFDEAAKRNPFSFQLWHKAHLIVSPNVQGLRPHPAERADTRSHYSAGAFTTLNVPDAAFVRDRCIVFRDPDTELEPQNPSLDNILNGEAGTIWNNMKNGDFFVSYQQQTNRAGQRAAPASKPRVLQRRLLVARCQASSAQRSVVSGTGDLTACADRKGPAGGRAPEARCGPLLEQSQQQEDQEAHQAHCRRDGSVR